MLYRYTAGTSSKKKKVCVSIGQHNKLVGHHQYRRRDRFPVTCSDLSRIALPIYLKITYPNKVQSLDPREAILYSTALCPLIESVPSRISQPLSIPHARSAHLTNALCFHARNIDKRHVLQNVNHVRANPQPRPYWLLLPDMSVCQSNLL
jgi:hypothetical protein